MFVQRAWSIGNRIRLLSAALVAAMMIAGPSLAQSVRPGDDFYGYANAEWLKTTTIPAGQATYGTSAMLVQINRKRVRDLIEDAAAHPAPGAAQKVGDYYAAVLDVAAIEARGLAPLKGELDAIAALSDRRSLSAALGATLRADIDNTNHVSDRLFGLGAMQGFDDADHYYPHLLQGGLGMPDRDDYLDASLAKATLRAKYQKHIADMLRLNGATDADARAARVLALEIEIARVHATVADTEDPAKENNLWLRADFDAKAPGMDWAAYFGAAGLDHSDKFIVWQPAAMTGVSALVAQTPIEVWQDHLRVHLLDRYAEVLPHAYRVAHFAFFGAALTGAVAPPSRADQAAAMTEAQFGEDVGRLYVQRYFPPAAKARAVAMVDNLRAVYRTRIPTLAWMSPVMRQMAMKKLDTLEVGLGYPDRWTDDAALDVRRDDPIGDQRRAEHFKLVHARQRLGQPVGPADWPITPQIVGAVIQFTPNAIEFSAGLLQPPYFDPQGDDASNYGSAGAGIAHEMDHTFDELGNQFDEKGRLVNWWTAEDLARYRAAAAPLVAEFSAYCAKPGLCVNGRQVMGEDLADLTGLIIAHDAYLLSLHGRSDVVKDGLTGEQRFFLSFARRWRRLTTDDALRSQIATDIHAPGEYRSDTVRNLQAWYDAFGVKPGDKLYLDPAARPHIW